jgi:hypothetical protein
MKRIIWTPELLAKLPRSKEEAILRAENKYFTGAPCENGHLAPTIVNGGCFICKRERTALAAERRRRRNGIPIQEAHVPQTGQSNGKELTSLGVCRREFSESLKRTILEIKVRCECGKEYWMRCDSFWAINSCRSCASSKAGTKHGYTKGMNGPSENKVNGGAANYIYQMFHSAKKRAKKSGVEFNLELDDLPQPATCPVFGIELDWSIREESGNRKPRPNAPSIDRLDPSKGYTKENSVVLSYLANVMKNDGSAREHEQVAEWLEAQAMGYS